MLVLIAALKHFSTKKIPVTLGPAAEVSAAHKFHVGALIQIAHRLLTRWRVRFWSGKFRVQTSGCSNEEVPGKLITHRGCYRDWEKFLMGF